MIFIGDDDFHHHNFTLMISLVEHDFHRFAYGLHSCNKLINIDICRLGPSLTS